MVVHVRITVTCTRTTSIMGRVMVRGYTMVPTVPISTPIQYVPALYGVAQYRAPVYWIDRILGTVNRAGYVGRAIEPCPCSSGYLHAP